MPKAYVVSGVGNNKPSTIINELKEMGWEVEWLKSDNRTFVGIQSIPDDGDIYIGHSRGALAVINEFGGGDKPVFALGSPDRPHHDNVTYSQSITDPVGLLDVIDGGGFNLDGGYVQIGGNPHDKNIAFDKIKGDIQSLYWKLNIDKVREHLRDTYEPEVGGFFAEGE